MLLAQTPALPEGRGALYLMVLPRPDEFWVLEIHFEPRISGCPNVALGDTGLYGVAVGREGMLQSQSISLLVAG